MERSAEKNIPPVRQGTGDAVCSRLIWFFLLLSIVLASSAVFAEDPCFRHFQHKEYDRALEECTRVINAGDAGDRGLYEYYTTRGLLYKIMGRYDEALSDFTIAAELGTESRVRLSFTYNDRGMVYQKKGQYDRAISDFYQAIYLNPGSYAGMYNIARAFSLINRADLACKWLRKSRENGFSVWKEAVQREKSFRNIRKAQCYKDRMAGK